MPRRVPFSSLFCRWRDAPPCDHGLAGPASGPLTAAVSAIGCALLLAACQPEPAEEPPLTISVVDEQAFESIVADAVSTGLTARDPEGRVIPGLAQSWRVSDDGLSIVFRLRDARFAGGAPVRAADVVQSIERAHAGHAGPQVKDMLAGVTDVSAPLPDIVEIALGTPQPEILELLATPDLAIRARGTRALAGAYVPAPRPGPEDPQLAEGEVHLVANGDHHDAASLSVRGVILKQQTPDVAIRDFNRGATDMVLGGRLDGLGTARVTAKREALRLDQPRAALLLLVNQKSPPLDDPQVRTALSLAINRTALGPGQFGSQAAAPVTGLTPPGLSGYAPAPPDWAALPFAARQQEARRLLAEAGIEPAAERPKLAVAVSDSPAEERLMTAIAADFAAIGIDMLLERRPAAAHRKAVDDGAFSLALVRVETAIDSPLPFLLPNRCGANRHGVCLPEADALLTASWTAPSLSERMAALAAAERLWAEDGAAIGIVRPLGWSLVSERIAGFSTNPSAVHALRHLSLQTSRSLIR